MRRLIFAAAVIVLSSGFTAGHTSLIPDTHPVQQNFKLEKVAGSVHVLFGSGGNIGVSYGADGLLTIDTQFARFVPQIKAELAKLGSDKPRFVFNTHFHGDHTGGNVLFGADAMIIAHQNVLERLMSKVDRQGNPQEPMAKAGLPSITYYDGLSIHMNGERIKAVHFPKGHTDGDTVIFFTASNVVHLGDDFFAGRFPFVDLNSGGSVQGLTMNIGKLIQMIPADAKLIPGHGPVSTIDDLRKYHEMLVETTLTVRGHMKAGKSYDDVKKAGLPEKYKSWSPEGSFINEERWIETIYKSYEMKMKKE
ncbi:MAG: MBL fold metallo-hydrolase [Acidobacteriota bacterium]|nr:MBL fold metallo-hydrolase [Acidobacteriota bacterium]MDH3528031.1 MBL fold metallo-hydrolase [Acidobacteriota bacterium]